MYCDTNQLPELPFCDSHPKPHGSRGLGKNYHIHFDPNLGHYICAICRITCACVACKSMFDRPWISSFRSTKQARYQPVINCTYWPVIGPYKNWYIIELTPKSITSEAFDEIHQVVLDGISENMASLVQLCIYGTIDTDDITTNGLYVIQFLSDAYTLKNNTTINGQVISSGKLVVKAKYLCSMQENTNWCFQYQLVFSCTEQRYCALTNNSPAEITCPLICILFCIVYASEMN